MAQEGPIGCLAGLDGRRRAVGPRRRRSRTHHDEARRSGRDGRGHRHDARRSHLVAERVRPRAGRLQRRRRRRTQRAHRQRGPRLVRRYAAPQARPRPAGKGGCVRRTRFDDVACPIARATDLIGDWWTPLVMREAFYGRRRFDEFQTALEIPRAVLTARLKRLCDEGMLQRVEYQQSPARYEYRLTDKGRAFWDVLAAMFRWGSDWMWPEGEQAT